MQLSSIHAAHVVGIGGSGVSAVARWLASNGVAVTGSDGSASPAVEALRASGISVSLGHAATNLPAAVDAVIYSTAVPDDSPELVAARQRGIPIYSYPQVLGQISASRRTLAVAGTNGKSTTAALLASILEAAGKDPLAIIGAQLAQWNGSNYRAGAGDFVIEACEHQAHFLELQPFAACVTNVAEDHLDFYGDLAAIEKAFVTFIRRLPVGGTLVYNADDHATSAAAAASGHAATISFSTARTDVDLAATSIDQRAGETSFDAVYRGSDPVQLKLPMVGSHNVSNALAAIGLALAAGVRLEDCAAGLASYRGLSRRMERVGTLPSVGAPVISDYAHHPDAIRACLDAAARAFPGQRRLVLFQPHQGNRTRLLMDQFAASFTQADQLIVAEVYRVPGREHGEDAAVSSSQLVSLVHQHQPATPVAFAEDEAVAEDMVRRSAKPGDVIMVIGAGTIDGVARRLVAKKL